MEADTPFITIVKQKVFDEQPELDQGLHSFDEALSYLCSFFSVSDFHHFLSSTKFESYALTEDPWVVFEIGLYHNHTITVEFIPSKNKFVLIDPHHRDIFPGSVAESTSLAEFQTHLGIWLNWATHQ